MPFHKNGAYDGFDSFDEAKEHYRRCRHRKDFILSDAGVESCDPTCARCGSQIKDPPRGKKPRPGYVGNRCVYIPRLKKCVALHYLCAWENTMGAIYQTERLI